MFHNARGELQRLWAAIGGALAALCCGGAANADCTGKFHSKKERPIYEVVACGPAEQIIESLRQSRPERFGTFSYTDADVVVTVKAANEDARKLVRGETEYWYYAAGCADIREGMKLVQPELRELCCDVWPVSDLPCGAGGMQLLTLKARGDA
jgi:hypothetical protein